MKPDSHQVRQPDADGRIRSGLTPSVVRRARQRPVCRRHPSGNRRRLDRARLRPALPLRASSRRCPSPRWPAIVFRGPHLVYAAAVPTRPAAFSKPNARSRSCASVSRATAKRCYSWPRKPRHSRRTIAQASSAIAALNAEHHRQEKAIVGFEAQLQRAADEDSAARAEGRAARARAPAGRGGARDARPPRRRKRERRSAGWSRTSVSADERLTAAQRRLFEVARSGRRPEPARRRGRGVTCRARRTRGGARGGRSSGSRKSGAELEARARR